MITQNAAKASSKFGAIWTKSTRPRVALPQFPQRSFLEALRQKPVVRFLWNIRELIVAGTAYLIYMFARKVILSDIVPVATDNAHKVVALEQKLHFFWEPGWQSWAIENTKWLVITMNWAYIMTFFPVIALTAIVFYLRDRPRYIFYRNVILTSYVLALLVFILFPLTPPRMLGPEFGLVDAIAEYGPAVYGGREMAFFYNAFAAMPSLHFGWTILFGILFWNTRGPRWATPWLKLWGVCYPALTFFAITLTGNHYILDAMGGAVVAMLSLAVYNGILFWRGRSRKPETTSRPESKSVNPKSREMPARGRPATA